MSDQSPNDPQIRRESGAVIHRRETNWQLYFPFLLGGLVLLAVFLGFALPAQPVWRDRAQAMGDFLYTFFCIIPILICQLPIYLILLMSIYGMSKAHDGAERPLRKLENMAEGLATRIEAITTYINEKTATFSETVEPLDTMTTVFDKPMPTQEEEVVSDD